MDQSFGMLKPDAIQRNLLGSLISRIDHNFRILDMEMRVLTPFEIRGLYKHHILKTWWPRLEATMQEGPSVLLHVRHRERSQETQNLFRLAALDIRMDYSTDSKNQAKNLIHATEMDELVQKELELMGFGLK